MSYLSEVSELLLAVGYNVPVEVLRSWNQKERQQAAGWAMDRLGFLSHHGGRHYAKPLRLAPFNLHPAEPEVPPPPPPPPKFPVASEDAELSFSEIGRRLGITHQAASAHFQRGMRKLARSARLRELYG